MARASAGAGPRRRPPARRRPRRGAVASRWPTSLGWLVAVGGGLGARRASAPASAWLGRVAVAAVRLVARGALVPTLPRRKRRRRRRPRPVGALGAGPGRRGRASTASPRPCPARSRRCPAGRPRDRHPRRARRRGRRHRPRGGRHASSCRRRRPSTRTTAAVAEAVVTRLDGSPFEAPVAAGAEVSKRHRALGQAGRQPRSAHASWSSSTRPTRATPGSCRSWAPVPRARCCRSRSPSPTARPPRPLADELARLERIFPALLRAGALRRGQVYLSQDEAWELMTVTGAVARGRRLRRPGARRCRGASRRPALRLFAEPTGDTRRRRPPARATCAGRCCSTTSSSPPPRSPGWPPRPARWCARAAGGSSSTGST